MERKPNDLWTSLKEWSIRVPQKWWDMISIPLSTVPFLLGVMAFLLWGRNTEPPLPIWIMLLVGVGAVLFVLLSFLAFNRVRVERDTDNTTLKLKRELDKLILEGERIEVILGGNTEADYDRCEDHIQQWTLSVDGVIKGTEYEYIWKSNTGLATPEDLSGLVGLPLRFAAERNYMAKRLSRLKEISDGL